MGEWHASQSRMVSDLISRRNVVAFGGAAVAMAAHPIAFRPSPAQAATDGPRPGGTLRLGLGGGSTSDSLSPLATLDSVMIDVGFGLYNGLVENGADNRPIPELAYAYEPKATAAGWIFSLRQGVTFHNGKEFDADDAIYSLNLHRGDTMSGAAGSMRAVSDIKRLSKYQIEITLTAADADFPVVLSDFHIMMVPNGFKDWPSPVGTGAFRVDAFDPGVRIVLKKSGPYWKAGRGHLDAVEVTVINDTGYRMNALISGQVDAINRADPRTVSRLERSPNFEIVRAAGGWFPTMAMQTDHAPYTSLDLRHALKYAVDREQMIKTLFSGYGTIGNDHPIPRSDPYFNAALPQTPYDLDKAAYFFKKAKLNTPDLILQTSDAAFNGATDMADLVRATAGRAGIAINVKRAPANGYFNDVWLKRPFVASYWGGRPAATQMLSVAYQSGAPWNETHWSSRAFETMLSNAKAETDELKRKALIGDMQAMLNDAGGSIIPCFRDWLDAHNMKVGGHTPHGGFDMDNGRIAEKAYLKV